jgi:hypothetical protein
MLNQDKSLLDKICPISKMETDEKGRQVEVRSPLLEKPMIKRQFQMLDDTIKSAQKRIDFTTANDKEIQRAIEIVERFIRRKRRVCYGGQAINALLSKERQFYDEKYSIPDYDFFSPNFEEDTAELIKELEKGGFDDVNKKLSVHDGTSKILMNFIPVADCTDLHPSFFKIVQKRAKSVNGILYCDPDFLRMMMYLELSRPRGEVERWKKVFERLTLLNDEYHPTGCTEPIVIAPLPKEERGAILEFCIKRKRVLMGPECIILMEEGSGKTSMEKLVDFGGPVIFLSSQAKLDGEDIADILKSLRGRGVEVHEEISPFSNIPNFTMVKMGGRPIALIFQEEACHSYSLLKLGNGVEVRTATHDLMLNIYYSIYLFGKKEKAFFQTPIYCLIGKLHGIEQRARNKPSSYVPAFGLRCSGHQQGIATLLKKRAMRTEKEKKKPTQKTRRLRR